MKTSIKLAVTVFFVVLANAVISQDIKWAVREGGTGVDYNYNIAVDKNKNVYTGLTNTNTTSTTFNGACTITGGNGAYDATFCKMDSSGNCLASKYFAPYYSEIRDMHVDDSANVYLTGYFYSTKTFCSSLTPYGLYDVFVSKYTSSGVCEWTVKAGSTGNDYGLGINTDSSGNVYVSGLFQGTATFGTINLTALGTEDGFIAKYNRSGVIQWAKRFGGAKVSDVFAHDVGWGISNVANGIFYLVGAVDSTASFGSSAITLTVPTVDSADFFLAKMDTAGNFYWVKSAKSLAANFAQQVIQDKWNNVFISGTIDTGANFGTYTYHSTTVNPGIVQFVARYDSSGSFKWVTPMGYEGSAAVLPSIALRDSAIWFTGVISATSAIGQFTVGTNGGSDILIGRLDYNGKPLWAKNYGGSNYDIAYRVALDTSGIAYVTGQIESTVAFGSTNLSPLGTGDGFILKIASALPITSVGSQNQVCKRSSFNVNFKTNETYVSGNIFTLQLSDTSGYFGHPTNIGMLTGITAGTVSGMVPDSIKSGSKYRVRIIASNPVDTGEEYPQNINIAADVPAAPTAQSICSGSSHTFAFSNIYAGTGGNQIEWAINSSFSGSTNVSSPATINMTDSTGTTDTLWIRSRVSATGCISSTVSTTATIRTPPSTTATNSGPYCSYGTIALSGGPGSMSSYSWSGPGSFTSTSQNPTRSASGNGGTYTLTGTDANGCTASASTSVTVNTPPTTTASSNSPVCTGQALTLIASPGSMTTYAWSGPVSYSSNIQSPNVSSTAMTSMAGTYSLTVTDANGCTSSATTSVTIHTPPTATASNSGPYCAYNSIALTG